VSPLLLVRKLSKVFGGLHALQEIDLEIDDGEIVGVIGPNGSGKTTLFNVISGIYPASGGMVKLLQRYELTRLPPHRITALGIARTFQNQRLFNQMTVLQNVLVGMCCHIRTGPASILLGTPRARAEQRAAETRGMELLTIFGSRLAPRRHEPAYSLSYANRRRLEIARALATEPKLLLLDEPAAGMNPTETQELMNDIMKIRDRGVTIVVIEHDMRLVQGICSRVVALDHGIKLVEGDFSKVRNHPAVLEAYLGHRAVERLASAHAAAGPDAPA
jgi:ABC-type branched-subunit amino acid transport system ATPase component